MYEETLLDWNFWGNFKINYIEREYDLSKYISNRYALVLYGVRRAGKSYLAYGYLKKLIEQGHSEKETLILNFEDPRIATLKAADLPKIYEEYLKLTNAQTPIIVLDEVQNIQGWEKFVRYLIENKQLPVIVTGSSSKLMSKEYATTLTGRHLDIEVYPLSFTEYLKFKGITLTTLLDVYKHKPQILHLLEEYLEYGGHPEIALLPNPKQKEELLRTYFIDILAKDIAIRYKIKNYPLLESLAKIYTTNIATHLSLRKIAKTLNQNLHTIERYTTHLETARLIITLKKLSRKAKEVERSIKKIYTIDIGYHTKIGQPLTKDLGRILENTVLLHLARKHKPNQHLYYYTTTDNREVDFAIKQENQVTQLIQVTYQLREENHKQWHREVGSLLKASKELGCKNLLIITWNQEQTLNIQGKQIQVKPLWKWLLNIP